MPVATGLRSAARRIAEKLRLRRSAALKQDSIENIDTNATAQARDRQVASDERADAAGSPAEQGGQG